MSGDRRTDGRTQLARDTLLSLAAITIVGGSAALYNVAVGRFLGDEVLGHAGLALAVGLGAAQLATAGLAPATTRFAAALRAAGRTDAAQAALRRGIGLGVALGCVVASAALLSSSWWAGYVHMPEALVGATVALIALQSGYLALKAGLYGTGRVRGYALTEVVGGAAFLAALVALVGWAMREPPSWMHGAGALLAPFLAANAVFVMLAVWLLLRDRAAQGAPSRAGAAASRGAEPAADARLASPPEAARDELTMGRYAVIAWIGSAAAMARVHLAVLATGAAWPAAEVGLLQAAMAFVAAVLLVPRAIELALFPSMAGAFGRADDDAFRSHLSATLAASVTAVGAVSGGLIVAGPELLTRLYGPEFAAARPALDGAVASAWMLGLAVPAIVALSSARAVVVPNVAGVLGLLASGAAWLWWVPQHGAAGAAAGLAVGSLLTLLIPVVAARHLYGLPLLPVAPSLLRSLVLLFVAVAATRIGSAPAVLTAVVYALAVVALDRRTLAPLVGRAKALS
ncbi:MAG: lipopolysaccharide biosynthesis protein [Anaerolineae bacterium]